MYQYIDYLKKKNQSPDCGICQFQWFKHANKADFKLPIV